ncbi:terminase small subunit [Rhizobium sp. BK456]|uniref:terminase small subunit n=1 Tax=Rhizobium sp. BK456 TaxID=2587007 RepID=UPI001617E086|nr:terminase small subunit [Rhizobium sp. BK456]MBB3520987.1 phage terminase Nu1 subunit (DNA packaging protein) [Rhizobium sp. BK456]
MARRKSVRGVTSDDENLDETWAPPSIDNDDPSSSHREADKHGHMSLKQCAALLGRNRTTVEKWIDLGCPYVTKANRDLGLAWVLDIADVVRWLERHAAETTAERFGKTVDGDVSEGDAKRRRLVALMHLDEAEAAAVLRSQVRMQLVIDEIEKLLTEVRGGVASIPDIVAGKVDPKHAVKVRKDVDDTLRALLDSLSVTAVMAKITAGD